MAKSAKKRAGGGASFLATALSATLVLGLMPFSGAALADIVDASASAELTTISQYAQQNAIAKYDADEEPLAAGISVAPSDPWTNYADTTWYVQGQTSFTLTSAAQLAGLAQLVNNGTSSFEGVTITLGNDINLAGHSWIPIGGDCQQSGYVPDGPYFAGFFNGANKVISNMAIDGQENSVGYGLFGCVASTGGIYNLTVNGSIALSGAAEYVGGIAGYTNGSIYNCHTNVTINVNSGSNVGGIAGALENNTSDVKKIQYCSVVGSIKSAKRLGGIVGGVYCLSAGTARIDNCSVAGTSDSSLNICSTNTSTKAYSGGVVGYCRGWVSNSYARYVNFDSDGGHYMAGIAGLMQGSGPMASMYNCYSQVTFGSGCNSSYDRPIVGTADFSSILPFYNIDWIKSTTGYNQPTDGTWGHWNDFSEDLESWSSSTMGNLGNAFTYSDSGYPILTWEDTGIYTVTAGTETENNTPGSEGEELIDCDPDTGIFVDGTLATQGDGTKASPYNDLQTALTAAQSATDKTVYVRGTIYYSNSTDALINIPDGVTIVRSSILDNTLISVGEGATLTINGGTIDGNKSAIQNEGSKFISDSLIRVWKGSTLYLNGVDLQNNYSSQGSALRIDGGSVTISSGNIKDNDSVHDGGAAAIFQQGTLTLKGGEVSSNTAVNNGGAISLYNGSTFNMSGGSILGNTATEDGGGVFVGTGANAAVFNFTGGEITKNEAKNGGAILNQGEVTLNGGSITSNSAEKLGGAISNTGGTLNIIDGVVFDNHDAYSYGIYVPMQGTVSLTPSSSLQLTDTIALEDAAVIYLHSALQSQISIDVIDWSKIEQTVVVCDSLGIATASISFVTNSTGSMKFKKSGKYIRCY